jgi:hypothetical protein
MPKPAGCPGCVSEREIGAAGLGAVGVGAGMLKVRMPRLPKLKPLPARACAVAVPNANTTAAAMNVRVNADLVMVVLSPRWPGRNG